MPIDNDSKKKLFELTLAVYRVTGLFPEREALRHQIRDSANHILEEVVFFVSLRDRNVTGKHDELEKIIAHIEGLLGLFKLTRSQHFINDLNFDILEWEYKSIADACEEELKATGNKIQSELRKITAGVQPKESIADVIGHLTDRQRDLLGYLKNNGKQARLKQVVAYFPTFSEKTIRNDLKVLCEKNLVQLNGRAPQSYYSLR